MAVRVTPQQVDLFRSELIEGYNIDTVAQRHGVSAATVKKHAAHQVGSRQILIGTEVHIDGARGRWEFLGDIGNAKTGEQYATFRNVRTGRSRVFYTSRITTVHIKK